MTSSLTNLPPSLPQAYYDESKSLQAYFDVIRKAVDDGIISKEDYRALLVKPNPADPVYEALISGKREK